MRCSALTLVLLGTTAVAWPQGLVLTNPDFSQVGADGKPSGWTLSTWYASPVPTLSLSREGEGAAVTLEFPRDAPTYTVALHQPLPPLPAGSPARVRFRYRAHFAGERRTSVAVSGGPGCGVPCSRVWFAAERDDQWHDADLRVATRLVNRTGSVLEFTFNDEFRAGDRFALAQVSVTLEPPPPLRLGCTDPVSGVVFTDQPRQTLRGVLGTGPAASPDHRAQVALCRAEGTDEPLATQDCGTGEKQTEWAFDLERQPPGRYRVVATLHAAAGALVARQELTVWRVAPDAHTTRVLAGHVCRGATPLVPFGTYHVSDTAVAATNRENLRIGKPPLDRDAMLAGLTQVGLTTAFFSWGIPTNEYLDAAARHGYLVIPEAAGLGQEWGGKPLEEQVAPLADDPRIFAWGGYDEPSETTLERAIQVYRGLKSAAPRKLVVTTFHEPAVVDLLDGQAAAGDLLLVDIYDIRRPDSDLGGVGTAVAHVVQYARQHGGLAVGVTPQAFVFSGPEPTPAQLRLQIYLGLVNGAVAFFPYAYVEDYGERPFSGPDGQPAGMSANPARQRWWLPDSVLWQALPQLSRELTELTPLILQGRPLAASAGPSPVQFLAARVADQGYLVAANPQAGTNELVVRLEPALPRLTPLFGTPAAEPQGTALALSFGAYEVKVFSFPLAPDGPATAPGK